MKEQISTQISDICITCAGCDPDKCKMKDDTTKDIVSLIVGEIRNVPVDMLDWYGADMKERIISLLEDHHPTDTKHESMQSATEEER